MKIIKHKNEDESDIVEFTCPCGCVWQAEKEEYYAETDYTSLSVPIKHKVWANCPECYKMISASKPSYIEIPKVTLTSNKISAKGELE